MFKRAVVAFAVLVIAGGAFAGDSDLPGSVPVPRTNPGDPFSPLQMAASAGDFQSVKDLLNRTSDQAALVNRLSVTRTTAVHSALDTRHRGMRSDAIFPPGEHEGALPFLLNALEGNHGTATRRRSILTGGVFPAIARKKEVRVRALSRSCSYDTRT